MKNNEALNVHDQGILLTAYMNLFNTLVKESQAKKMPLGNSWCNALCEMRKVVVDMRKNNSNKSTRYLQNLYNSQNDSTFKKMMESEDKDKITIPQEPVETLHTKAKTAHNELKAAIESVENAQTLIAPKKDNFVMALFANGRARQAA